MTAEKDSNRKVFADIAKGLTIILVVMEHNAYIYKYQVPTQAIILSFHMPLFYFVSGLFFSSVDSLQALFTKRLHSLVKPYVISCLLFFLLKSLKDWIWPDVVKFVIGLSYGTGESLVWPYQQLWFLTSLFVTVMGYSLFRRYFFAKIKSRTMRLVVLFAVLLLGVFFVKNVGRLPMGGLPWNIDLCGITLFFYGLGFEVRRWFIEMKLVRVDLFLGVLLIFAAFHFFFTLNSADPHALNLYLRKYDNFVVNTVEAVSGIFLVMLFSLLIADKSRVGAAMLSYIGNRSLTIFIFHELLMPYLSDFGSFFLPVDSILLFFFSVSLTVFLSLLLHELLWRMPVANSLLLNRRTSKLR